MNAAKFNQAHSVGAAFIHQVHPDPCGGTVVRTVDVARDFKCGCVVEINREPYFVKVETLTPAH
ncbi:hypothetical protein [Serratia sp. JSRIV004]|uniref:hypothetical protein n=1 Tax=Serratia sp. JSRIV004 TaxID=2831895 RepID=UPI001CBD7BCD|nr:hypothetical protein [Serratia sp. JSRIV004]UAN55470.1 hypothetical protein KGP21_17395 [Serratia sp. JSRIV004]UAN57283.1 hypothetical protein KGP21_27420 [Serratia sp. JSRIV004]